MKILPARLQAFCVEALVRAGVGPEDAATTAEVLVTTDTWGTFTHGTKALRGYIRRLLAGGLRTAGRPRIVADGPAWALVDGDSSLGMVASVFAMDVAIAKAAASGIGYVGVCNSCHFGAAGFYAAMAPPRDMIGIAMANDIPTVNAPGAKGAVMGSNPFAFAAPAESGHPLLLDMATSTVAGGKVFAAAALGRPIPEGWLMDAAGRPTVDASLFSHAASLTPLGGYKGFGLALMIETLAGVLTGAAMSWQIGSWAFADPAKATGHGAAFVAINIASFMPVPEFRQRLVGLIREIHAAPKVEGVERIFVPGEIELERRDRALK